MSCIMQRGALPRLSILSSMKCAGSATYERLNLFAMPCVNMVSCLPVIINIMINLSSNGESMVRHSGSLLLPGFSGLGSAIKTPLSEFPKNLVQGAVLRLLIPQPPAYRLSPVKTDHEA